MQAVKSEDTSIELQVRRIIRDLGYRYRLHRKDLPGKPDLVFISRRKVIFIHGCFWHGHNCSRGNRVPKSNTDYWITKIARNVHRDRRVRQQLVELGWAVEVIWECEVRLGRAMVMDRLARFLV